jgi:hypothetical protein
MLVQGIQPLLAILDDEIDNPGRGKQVIGREELPGTIPDKLAVRDLSRHAT